jgi:1-phosphofructokinase
VTAGDWSGLISDAVTQSRRTDIVCVSGSMPPGCPPDGLATLIRRLEATGRPVWVDTSGAALAEAAAAAPTGIKVNDLEIGAMLGREIRGPAEATAAARELRARGVELAVITLGAAGAVMVNESGAWWAHPPPMAVVSPTGAGDAFLAGLAAAMVDGLPPEACLRHAVAAGSANALQRDGGRVDRADVERILPGVAAEALNPSA